MKTLTPGIGAQLAAQAFDHLVHRRALAARLEVHEQAPAVAVAGVDDQRIDGGVGADHLAGALQQLGHGRKGNILDRLDGDQCLADVLIGEEALGQDHEQRDGGDEGAERDAQHHAAVAQCPVERAFVGCQHCGEAALEPCGPAQAAPFRLLVPARKRLASIGTSVSDTKADTRIAIPTHGGELVEQQADHAGHEEDRDEHRDQRERRSR